MRGTITYIMVAPVLLSAKVLEITYCSTPHGYFGDYSLGVSSFMLWVLLLMSWCVVGLTLVQACVLLVTPSPPSSLSFIQNNVILLQLVLLGITTGLPRWDSHYPLLSHVFWPNERNSKQ